MNTLPHPTAPPHAGYSERRRRAMLAILFLVALCSYLDRHVVAILLEPIKQEFGASDTRMGLLTGFAFAIFYATLGIPVARWSDRGDRKQVISLALLTWSAFTVLCGFATSFWQLAMARVGVGVGEAGAIPPAQSLLADYFPPARRGAALAVLMSSATVGYVLAFIGGAWLAQHHGWRTALIAAGLPGLVLTIAVRWVLDEPRRTRSVAAATAGPASPTIAGEAPAADNLPQALRTLRGKSSYLWLLGGAASYGLVAYGALIFVPSFMVRSLGVTLTQVGMGFGSVSAAVALCGTLAGGVVADRLARRDARWYAWLPALACAAALPFQTGALLASSFAVFLLLLSTGGLLLGLGVPSMFTALHLVCGSPQRSLAVALLTFTLSLIGSGLGPLMTGALSDALAPVWGQDSLRLAMLAANTFLVAAAYCFHRCARALPADLAP